MSANKPHERRVGDTITVLDAQLKQRSSAGVETAVNLTGMTVTFTMINAATSVTKVSAAAATVVTAATGMVRYDFQTVDVDTAGIFWGTFKIVDGGEYGSFPVAPSQGVIWIHSATETAQQAYDATF